MSLDDLFLSPNNVVGRISPVPGPAEQVPFSALTPALLTQLALPTGAANVGFLPFGIGAVAEPVQTALRRIVFADQYSGSDLGAKINTADAALGALPGTIFVADGNATITTQIVLSNTDRVLEFGIGTYTLNIGSGTAANALLVKADRVTVRGKSKTASILKNGVLSKDDVVRAFKTSYPAGSTIINNVIVENLTIDGNQANITHPATDTYGNGVNINFGNGCEVRYCIIKNCVFQGALNQGSGDGTSKNNSIHHCDISACGEIGAGLEGGTYDSSIHDNNIHDLITVAEIAGGALAVLISQLGQTGTGNKAYNNIIDTIPADGILVQDGSAYADVFGNTLKNVGTTGGSSIKVNGITTSPNHISIRTNTIASQADKTRPAIAALHTSTAVGWSVIEGNKIADCNGGGVQINSGKNCSAVSNDVVNCGIGAGATSTYGYRASGSTVSPFFASNRADTCVGNGFDVQAGTTNAILKNNTSVNNGANYADVGTNTVLDGVLVAYTPAWTSSSGPQPALGNGSLNGVYVRNGNTVNVNLRLVIGSTTTVGTNVWLFSLPITPVSAQGIVFTGAAYALHSGISEYVGVVKWNGDTTVRIFTGAQPATTFGSATPFAWAATDELDMQISYTVTGGT